MDCLHQIPRTNFHRTQDNAIEKKFWGKFKVELATSFFFFQKGSQFQKLLHELKYNSNKELGRILAKNAAADLLENDYFADIDCIVPIPLHPKKFQKRGYNQAEWIAMGLEDVLLKPLETISLIRVKENATQTKKGVFERYTNTEGIFDLINPDVFAGKHVLLVDDVLTTGSTLEAAAQALLKADNIKISIFTLALA
jgi:ComF family protein